MSGSGSRRPGSLFGRGSLFEGDPFFGDAFSGANGALQQMLGGGGPFGGARQVQPPPSSSTAREIPVEGPDTDAVGGLPTVPHRLTGPVIDELPDHEASLHGSLFLSSPDHVEEPEEGPSAASPYQRPPDPQQQQEQQQTPQQAQQQPAAASAFPPPHSGVNFASRGAGPGARGSAEDLLAAMDASPPRAAPSRQAPPPPPPPPLPRLAVGRPQGGSGAVGLADDSPGSPLLVHVQGPAGPFSPRVLHLLDEDEPSPPPGAVTPPLQQQQQHGSQQQQQQEQQQQQQGAVAAAPLPADWLEEALGGGADSAGGGEHSPQVPWEGLSGLHVSIPTVAQQPQVVGQPPTPPPAAAATAAAAAEPRVEGSGRRASVATAGEPGVAWARPAGAASSAVAATPRSTALPPRQRKPPLRLQAEAPTSEPAAGAAGRAHRARARSGRSRRGSEGSEEDNGAAGEEWPLAAQNYGSGSEDPDWRPGKRGGHAGRSPPPSAKRARRG